MLSCKTEVCFKAVFLFLKGGFFCMVVVRGLFCFCDVVVRLIVTVKM